MTTFFIIYWSRCDLTGDGDSITMPGSVSWSVCNKVCWMLVISISISIYIAADRHRITAPHTVHTRYGFCVKPSMFVMSSFHFLFVVSYMMVGSLLSDYFYLLMISANLICLMFIHLIAFWLGTLCIFSLSWSAWFFILLWIERRRPASFMGKWLMV